MANNYIFITLADGTEAKGGSGTSCEKETKGANVKTFIDEARYLYKLFKKHCDNTACKACKLNTEEEQDCFLKYLDIVEGGKK